MATPTQLLAFRQLEDSCPHPFVSMVDTLFLGYLCVGTVRLKANNSLVRFRVTISDQAGVHEAEGKRSTPQPLGCLHLHGIGAASTFTPWSCVHLHGVGAVRVVDVAPQPLGCLHLYGVGAAHVVDRVVLLMPHIPCIEGVWLVTALMALQATAVAVGGEHNVVYDQSSDDFDDCRHAVHRSMATLLPRSIKADSDGWSAGKSGSRSTCILRTMAALVLITSSVTLIVLPMIACCFL